MTRQNIFTSLSLFRRLNASVLSVLFLLTLFSQNVLTLQDSRGEPDQERLTHVHDNLADVVAQPGKHSTETPAVGPGEILGHVPAPRIAHPGERFLRFPTSPLLPYYLVYTQTTASRF